MIRFSIAAPLGLYAFFIYVCVQAAADVPDRSAAAGLLKKNRRTLIFASAGSRSSRAGTDSR
jgi:hypothetical protein